MDRVPLCAALIVCSLAACHPDDAATSAGTLPTVLVTNTTCVAGHCDSLEVLGFPNNQPNVSAGLWSISLGLMTGPRLCVQLPRSATFVVSGPDSKTTYTWTPGIAVSLGTMAPAASRWRANPTTAEFVSARATGWKVALPGAQIVADTACTP